MISVGGVAVIGGTSGLPAGGTADDVLRGDGTWESAGDVVGGALEAIPAADLAGLTIEPLLPRASTGAALHHHRLDEASGTLADLGSGAVAATLVGSGWTRGAAGPYRLRNGVYQTAPASPDCVRISPTTVPAAGFTMAVTVLSLTRLCPANYRPILSAHTGVDDPSMNYLALWHQNPGTGAVYMIAGKGATMEGSSGYVIPDWARAFRAVVTYVSGSKLATLYVNGISRVAYTHGPAALGDFDRLTALGGDPDGSVSGSVYGGNPYVSISDVQVWGSVLTAAEIAADWSTVAGSLL